MEGVFNKIENLLMFSHITESGFKLTLQLLQNFNKSAVAEMLLQRWVTCGCCSEFREVDEFSVRYPQSSYFVLECSDCPQHVTWKLVSSLELQVECSGDVMSVRRASCMIQCGSFSSGWCFPLLSKKLLISGRRLRNRSSTLPRDNHLTSLCNTKSLYSVS